MIVAAWSTRNSATIICRRSPISRAPKCFSRIPPIAWGRCGICPIAGFELFLEACPALGFDVVPYCPVDEPAAGAFRSHAVQDGYGLVRQNDVDAFAHGGYVFTSAKGWYFYTTHFACVFHPHLNSPMKFVKSLCVCTGRGHSLFTEPWTRCSLPGLRLARSKHRKSPSGIAQRACRARLKPNA